MAEASARGCHGLSHRMKALTGYWGAMAQENDEEALEAVAMRE